MIANITEESKFHSFVVCQTKDEKIATKWPYHILSSNNQLIIDGNLEQSGQTFNYSIDSVCYNYHGVKLILSEGNWLKPLLRESELDIVKKVGKISFGQLELSKSINFMFYVRQDFVVVEPQYLLRDDCVVFEVHQMGSELPFREIPQELSTQTTTKKYFNFSSEYALLSDQHFLDCFIQGKKPISSYIRCQNSNIQSATLYQAWISPSILHLLGTIYVKPKL